MVSLTLSAQLELLQTCINNKLDLSDFLERHNYTYEDLVYRYNDRKLLDVTRPYQAITPSPFRLHEVPVVSFFSGSGGFDLGFEAAGFHHVASFEVEKLFCETMRKNRPQWNVFGPPESNGDLRNREAVIESLQSVGVKKNFEGVFHGGPPCQPFSIAANQRFSKAGENFKRIGFTHEEYGNLLFDYVFYIVQFRPRVFLLENVPGLATVDDGEQLSTALNILEDVGYIISKPTLLNASDYGVPQNRQRLLICGWRTRHEFDFPQKETIRVSTEKALEKSLEGVANHITRKHEAASILRYMELRYGGRDKLGRVDRLDPSLPSKTVIAGGTKGGGRSHLHPHIPRTLSVRESARLQTFPDEYVFSGPPARQFTQVGNAVPPLLAMKLAREIYETFYC
ncbi:MAG: DNA (cytosine-5-)-methyltransferase [bacterium]|nr:DNA (cytosine-5-)-methyltransferase [bacterium]